MLEYNEIKEGRFIVYNGEPYEVLSSHVFRKQQRKPVNATKLRNLLTNRIVENSFHVSEKVAEAEIGKKEVKFLYTNKGEYWFCEPDNLSKRFQLPESMIGNSSKFLKENSVVEAILFDDKIFGLRLPIKVDLKVTEAHPAVKGNTAQGATKEVVLETGATVQVPMFIKEGDTVRINTETGQYTDRVS
jgi:elongation factor P